MSDDTNEAILAGPDSRASTFLALSGLSLSVLLSSLGTSIANVALPTLAEAFAASFQGVQWVVIAYLLATTTLIVSVGRLGDMFGRRRLLLSGIALFTVASAFSGIASALWQLITARAVQGLGAAIMMALTLALVGETVPKEKTGSAMGMLGTMSAIGTALGPTLGGFLIVELGWQSVFLINIPLGLLAWVLSARALPADRRISSSERPSFDGFGMLLLALTLGVYALSMTLGRGRFGTLNLSLLAAAALGLGLFAMVEARVASPLLRLAMFRDRTMSAGFLTSALVTTVVMATLVAGPFYLSGALSLEPSQVGLVMSTGPIVAALTGIPAGVFVDRFGAARMIMAGLLGSLAGCCAMAMIPASFGVAGYVAPLAVITAGYALFQAANNTSVVADVPPDQRGVVSGLLNLARNLGLITGASAMGAVFAAGSAATEGVAARPDAVASGLHFTFAVAAALSLMALAIVLRSRARSS